MGHRRRDLETKAHGFAHSTDFRIVHQTGTEPGSRIRFVWNYRSVGRRLPGRYVGYRTLTPRLLRQTVDSAGINTCPLVLIGNSRLRFLLRTYVCRTAANETLSSVK